MNFVCTDTELAAWLDPGYRYFLFRELVFGITMDTEMEGGNSNCDGGQDDRRTDVQFGICLSSTALKQRR